METNDFNALLNNPMVVKLKGHSSAFLFYEPLNLIVNFIFIHRGIEENTDRRISITTSEKNEFSEVVDITNLQNITSRCTILVNCDEPMSAISYNLNINSKDKTISLAIDNLPIIGKDLIPHEELTGISINFD